MTGLHRIGTLALVDSVKSVFLLLLLRCCYEPYDLVGHSSCAILLHNISAQYPDICNTIDEITFSIWISGAYIHD